MLYNVAAILGVFTSFTVAQENSTTTTTGEEKRNDRATGGYAIESAEFNMRYLAEEEQVELTVTMKDNSWFGLVPGQRDMGRGGDMLVFFTDGEMSEFADYHSVGYAPPEQDSEQDLLAHPDRSIEFDGDGRITLFARRALDTGDSSDDFVIPLDQEFYIGYALNDDTNNLSYATKHSVAGSVAITLNSDGSPTWGELVIAESVDTVSAFDAVIANVSDFFGESAVTIRLLTLASALSLSAGILL